MRTGFYTAQYVLAAALSLQLPAQTPRLAGASAFASYAPIARVNPAPRQRTQARPAQMGAILLDADLTFRSPPPPWAPQDSANRLYRLGKAAIDDEKYLQAAEFFSEIHKQFPKSVYAPDSYYWEAFALYRVGGSGYVRRAIRALDAQQLEHPRARTASDGSTLATRLRGQLARSGDKDALRDLATVLESGRECSPTAANVQVAALSALQQIDAHVTYLYLRNIFESTESCSTPLRHQAVFVLSQLQTPEGNDLLLRLARADSDRETRAQAVHWLSQVHDSRAVNVLREILRSPANAPLREHALFALTQQPAYLAAGVFRNIAWSRAQSAEARTAAVCWLAEQRMPEYSDFLRRLYESDRSVEMRTTVVSAVANRKDFSDKGWLVSVARDSAAQIEVRKVAVAAAAQLYTQPDELFGLYQAMREPPLREQIILVLARHRERNAIEKLIDIAILEEDAELRLASLHWLRQSKDPKAVAFVTAYREKQEPR